MGDKLDIVKVSDLVALQRELSSKIRLRKLRDVPRLVAGFDLSFPNKHTALAVGVVLKYPELEIVEMKWVTKEVDIPYIPGLLSFREGPSIEKVYSLLDNDPDLLFFDGQGIAHPRGLGLAAHMALNLKKPSIGVAKSHLYGSYKMPGLVRGSFEYLYAEDKKVGVVLRTKDNVKPLFVSPGNYVDLEDCVEYTLKTCKGYRLPEPTRIADLYTKKLKKEVDLSEKR